MKKIGLACFLALSMCFALCADSVEDTQFKQYVELAKAHKDNPKGMTVCADYTYRIIFATLPVPADFSSVTPELIKNLKEVTIKTMKTETDDVRIIRNLKINFVYNYITSDKKIVAITVSYKDL